VLKEVGLVQNVVANRTTGHLVDGHLRVMLAMRENQPVVPVTWVELSEEEEHLILAALDPLAAMATADAGALDALLSSVQSGEEAVQAMLAELAESAGLYGPDEDESDAEPQIDRAEELRVKWGVEPGQLWRLPSRTPGQEHRLICGDCTDAAVVERVMGGEKARLAATSPPYSNQRDYKTGETDWLTLANGFISCCFDVLDTPGDAVINLGLEYKDGRVNDYWNPWLSYCDSIGHPLYGWYIWDKGSGFPGEWNGRLGPAHEWVFHFSNGRESANKWIKTTGESAKRGASGKRFRQKDGTLNELTSPDKIGQPFKIPDSVIRITREMARGIHTQNHPATFPVEFPEFIIQTWSKSGDTVLEPFSGSGTTIIAAENLSRQCRAVEISPGYVAVALERYATAFSIEPELIT
jgi:DNA modification methylase